MMMASKQALVTGAASGIGRAVVSRLVTEDVSVTALDVDREGLNAAFGDGVTKLVIDLGEKDARQRAIEAAAGFDYLINAAGIIRLKPIAEFTVDDWRELMTVNAEAIFFLCQGIGPTMPPGSAIVNLSSSSAKLATTTEAAVYAATKTTVLSITRSFAYALASIPVRVNAICPAIIDTPMQDAVLERLASLRGTTTEELALVRNASVPLGRPAQPEELAGYIWFMLSDEASYITGQALNYGGGYVTW